MNSEKLIENIDNFHKMMLDMDSDKMMSLVEKNIGDEAIEAIIDHIEDFYGIKDDEELGQLAQIMISGYLMGKQENGTLLQ